MYIQIIACRVFNRELSHWAARSPHVVHINWLEQGLHDTPSLLRERVAEQIVHIENSLNDEKRGQKPDAIVLGYGLCSNGVLGLTSGEIPLIIPRTDDCIALFLGSQKRYLELFTTMNGAYWLNNGWIESCGRMVTQDQHREEKRARYAELYGEDNADFLMEQEECWVQNYSACTFIHSDVYENLEYPKLAQDLAARNGWEYRQVQGDNRMLRMLTHAQWDEEEFLTCPPHHRVVADYTGKKIAAQPI